MQIPGMSSILCNVHPSVELLGLTSHDTPSFQTLTHDPQFSNQIDKNDIVMLSNYTNSAT